MSAPAVKEGINQPLARSFTMRVEDIERRNGVVLLNESDVLPEDPLIRGLSYNKKFRQGLSLTCRDTVEEHPFVVQSKHDAGLSCIFFLKGMLMSALESRIFRYMPKIWMWVPVY